jgi:hypothetical protein
MNKREIEAELNDLYNFVSAEENEDYGFSLSQSYDRIEYLEKLLKKLDLKELRKNE